MLPHNLSFIVLRPVIRELSTDLRGRGNHDALTPYAPVDIAGIPFGS